LSDKKIGLALGSGAARGIAHIGVLQVLEKEGIPVDMIAGTSAGAVVGALYARGLTPGRLKTLATELRWLRLAPLVDLVLPRTGLIGGKKIEDWFKSLIGNRVSFSELNIPFACVATDIMTGEEVVVDEGLVIDGVRASISIPGIFTVVKRDDRYLVDGGLVNPVPASILKKMGADYIIAVNVLPDITKRDRGHWIDQNKTRGSKEPNVFHILMQSVYIGTHSLTKSCLKNADIAIKPRVAHIGPADFQLAEDCIIQGKLAAQEAIPKIKKHLSA